MYKLMLPPDEESYSVEQSAESVTRVQLDGGAGRYRQVLFGVSDIVTVSWVCDENEYDYLRALYRGTKEGALPFLADLIIDKSELMEYTCHFVPKSFKLDSVKGLAYNVSASLEVTPVADDYDKFDTTIEFLLLYFGSQYAILAPKLFDKLQPHVNIIYPRIFDGKNRPPRTELENELNIYFGNGYVAKMQKVDSDIDNSVNFRLPSIL